MSKRVKKIIDGMTLEQKIGHMFVFGFSGVFPHPDIIEMIDKYNIAGYRIVPWSNIFLRKLKPGHPGIPRVTRKPQGRERTYCVGLEWNTFVSTDRYVETLNKLRRRSLETGAGIPLYICCDNEGGLSSDFTAYDFVNFPAPMGLTASGDPSLAFRVGNAIATQLKAIGIDCVQSPTVDVITNPNNIEIGTRSYSPMVDVVTKYAYQSMLGLIDGGVIPMAKHFPGRGNSDKDTHFDCPTVTESLERMTDIHLSPYKYLIEKGLPAIMLAHSIYPALDPSNEISTVSKPIITGLLREQMGFEGVVITDSFTMGGLVAKYDVTEAAIRSVEAGVDLVLLKDENVLRHEAYAGLLAAVRKGRIKEERINESVARTLAMKENFGLLDGKKGIVDVNKVEKIVRNPKQYKVEREASEKAILVLRNKENAVPLKKGARVLVIEETSWLQSRLNNSVSHSGALYEALVNNGVDTFLVRYDSANVDKVFSIIKERSSDADVIIYTGCFTRGHMEKGFTWKDIASLGKTVIFVSDSPLPCSISPDMQNVVVTFSNYDVTMQAAADVLSGKIKPVGCLDFDTTKEY